MLIYHLQKAQQRTKSQANKHRLCKEFIVEDLVYVKLQPYRQHSVTYSFVKNCLINFLPFRIISRIGSVAYKLQLPSTSKIHLVFYIYQLRKHVGQHPHQATLPEINDD